MADEKLEQVLQVVDRTKRDFLKKLVLGTAFAVPIVSSYSVNELAHGQVGSPPATDTVTMGTTMTTFVTTTIDMGTTTIVTTTIETLTTTIDTLTTTVVVTTT